MGWLKNSEVELHECLTSEGLKLGLVRIIGEKFFEKRGLEKSASYRV